MEVLSVRDLRKTYPGFLLKDVSFDLTPGRITGFIGRNGAGKTTTLKSLLGFVHPDAGEIRFFGGCGERELKQRLGYVAGGVDFYSKKKIKAISAVTASFYDHWDWDTYRDCCKRFQLDENKTPSQLSQGMKVKLALTLALSHQAELLILDEPTSGLDPVSREDLLELFLRLRDQGKTILFSTHITSDLEKCADNLIYIRNGEIVAQGSLDAFAAGYSLLEYAGECPVPEEQVLGRCRGRKGYSILVPRDKGLPEATLEEIMVHLEQEEKVWGTC